jgi:hypothetical protein
LDLRAETGGSAASRAVWIVEGSTVSSPSMGGDAARGVATHG